MSLVDQCRNDLSFQVLTFDIKFLVVYPLFYSPPDKYVDIFADISSLDGNNWRSLGSKSVLDIALSAASDKYLDAWE